MKVSCQEAAAQELVSVGQVPKDRAVELAATLAGLQVAADQYSGYDSFAASLINMICIPNVYLRQDDLVVPEM